MNSSKKAEMRRVTRRPTVAIRTMDPVRLQEALLGTFERFKCNGMDMEALIHFTLQAFPEIVDADSFVSMHRTVRDHILKNFAIHQSGPLRLAEFTPYRLVVCHTDDTDV